MKCADKNSNHCQKKHPNSLRNLLDSSHCPTPQGEKVNKLLPLRFRANEKKLNYCCAILYPRGYYNVFTVLLLSLRYEFTVLYFGLPYEV